MAATGKTAAPRTKKRDQVLSRPAPDEALRAKIDMARRALENRGVLAGARSKRLSVRVDPGMLPAIMTVAPLGIPSHPLAFARFGARAGLPAATLARLAFRGPRARGFFAGMSAHSLLPRAFKRAGQDQGPDELHQLLGLWHNRRRSILAGRQHLVNEAEQLLCELPLELREQLPDTKSVRPRLAALQRRNRRRRYDAPTRLRLQLLDGYHQQIHALDHEEKQVIAHLEELVRRSGSTLGELCGLSTRSIAELLVEVGDVRRFTEGGFARFNATAPLPASTAEGPGEPVRHRYNPGGNRRVNAVLHRMAITQLAREPRAQRIYANARAGGHTKKEARRLLKRHLSDVIYRRMIRDLHAQLPDQSLLAA